MEGEEDGLISLHAPYGRTEDQLVKQRRESKHHERGPYGGAMSAQTFENVFPKKLLHVAVIAPPEVSGRSRCKRLIHVVARCAARKSPKGGCCAKPADYGAHKACDLADVFQDERSVWPIHAKKPIKERDADGAAERPTYDAKDIVAPFKRTLERQASPNHNEWVC